MCMVWLCYDFVDGNVLMCIKKVKLIYHDCLPILMLLYIVLYIVLAYLMLYIVLAYLMLLTALSNAVCLHNASFFSIISAIAFYFHVFIFLFFVCVLVY